MGESGTTLIVRIGVAWRTCAELWVGSAELGGSKRAG